MKGFQDVHFVLSAERPDQLPADAEREVAFAGRSNAGKSSALNALAGQRLAYTSKTPGRTQSLNCYQVGPQRYWIDLPGYGYAQVSRAQRHAWGQHMAHYLAHRQALAGVVIFMDCRHPMKDSDLQLVQFCRQTELPMALMLTKADKLSRQQQQRQRQQVLGQITTEAALIEPCSARQGQGWTPLRQQLLQWLDMLPDDG